MRQLRAMLALSSSLCLLCTGAGCTNSGRGVGEAGQGGGAGAATTMAPGLERPGSLPRPPATRLPSELIPPGLQLQR